MVEGARLEIVWAFTRLGGSNPLASARKSLKIALYGLFLKTFRQKRRGSSLRFASKAKLSIIYPLASARKYKMRPEGFLFYTFLSEKLDLNLRGSLFGARFTRKNKKESQKMPDWAILA